MIVMVGMIYIANLHIKFSNNRAGSFGDYQPNKNFDSRQIDGNKRPIRTPWVMKRRKNVKVVSGPMDYLTSQASMYLAH